MEMHIPAEICRKQLNHFDDRYKKAVCTKYTHINEIINLISFFFPALG